jgi:hypothetical protein
MTPVKPRREEKAAKSIGLMCNRARENTEGKEH